MGPIILIFLVQASKASSQPSAPTLTENTLNGAFRRKDRNRVQIFFIDRSRLRDVRRLNGPGALIDISQMKAASSGEQRKGNMEEPWMRLWQLLFRFSCNQIEISTRQVARRIGKGNVPEWYGCCLYGQNRWRGLWPAQVFKDYDTEMLLTSWRIQTTIWFSVAVQIMCLCTRWW